MEWAVAEMQQPDFYVVYHPEPHLNGNLPLKIPIMRSPKMKSELHIVSASTERFFFAYFFLFAKKKVS
ncbi:MAG: hypothetical protein IJ489_07310 [Clostridia bacterium]|nr:hypothetical protein [Clostridia bacterium]